MCTTCPDATTDFIAAIRFDRDGLIPCIAQQHDTGEVLMMAWMNDDSLALTLDTRQATYWSRSRSELWRKGATSGHTQRVREVSIDCDGDTLLLVVDQTGPACHTGAESCFDAGGVLLADDPDEARSTEDDA